MPQTAFRDQTAVVTGAGGTLCSAVAVELARCGAKAALLGRTMEKLEPVAKAGVVNLTQWLAGYLAPAGIRVNSVAPRLLSEPAQS